MERYLGKTVWLRIIDPKTEEELFYTCKIIDVDSTHVTFIDRDKETLTWLRTDVHDIKPKS